MRNTMLKSALVLALVAAGAVSTFAAGSEDDFKAAYAAGTGAGEDPCHPSRWRRDSPDARRSERSHSADDRGLLPAMDTRWRVLYVGDAGTSDPVYDSRGFAALGKGDLDKHSKLPDLVVHMEDRRCLILLEAASSHGPVDSKRRRELARVFENTIADLVFVSCFRPERTCVATCQTSHGRRTPGVPIPPVT